MASFVDFEEDVFNIHDFAHDVTVVGCNIALSYLVHWWICRRVRKARAATHLKHKQECFSVAACIARTSPPTQSLLSEEPDAESEDTPVRHVTNPTEPLTDAGRMLLEAYGVFGASAGTWSGDADGLEDSDEEDDDCTTGPIPALVVPRRAPDAGRALLEKYQALGAAPGAWDSSPTGTADLVATPQGRTILEQYGLLGAPVGFWA